VGTAHEELSFVSGQRNLEEAHIGAASKAKRKKKSEL
jgi:hypothetical protein